MLCKPLRVLSLNTARGNAARDIRPPGNRGSCVQWTIERRGGADMYGVFGGYTRWAVVFLIIFVLFILLVPYGAGAY